MMIDETMIQKLAEYLRFQLDEEDILLIKEEFSAYEEMLKVFDRIDTENTEEMISPVTVLREEKEDGMAVLPQAVKK
jgi:Asp-tRNA(Asn)/Glu-tRNA(Gln) amidotransferase C subunit